MHLCTFHQAGKATVPHSLVSKEFYVHLVSIVKGLDVMVEGLGLMNVECLLSFAFPFHTCSWGLEG